MGLYSVISSDLQVKGEAEATSAVNQWASHSELPRRARRWRAIMRVTREHGRSVIF